VFVSCRVILLVAALSRSLDANVSCSNPFGAGEYVKLYSTSVQKVMSNLPVCKDLNTAGGVEYWYESP
jgi:hypothetical protein